MNHEPDVCYCGRQAIGLGLAPEGRSGSYRWFCGECSLILDEIKRVRRPSAYELAARAGGMEAAGELLDEFGTDLAAWDEEQVLRFVGACWKGTADRLRELVKDGGAPF